MVISKGEQIFNSDNTGAPMVTFVTTVGLIVVITNRVPDDIKQSDKDMIEKLIKQYTDMYINDMPTLLKRSNHRDLEIYIKTELARDIAEVMGITLTEQTEDNNYPDDVFVFIHESTWRQFKNFGYPANLNFSMHLVDNPIL
jgi:hypothetical protein